jgi:hypothetical protein
MIYKAVFETTAGMLNAVWDGDTNIQVFWGDEEAPFALIGAFDYSQDYPRVPSSAESMARRVQAWFWEHERGMEIERITVSTTSELDRTW